MMLKPKGVALIDSAVSTFTSVIKKIETGVTTCKSRIDVIEDREVFLKIEKKVLNDSIAHGEKVMLKIHEIVGV